MEQIAHAVSVRNASMSLGSTVLPMSTSEVQSIVVIISWTCSSIAFACEFLTLVGLCLSSTVEMTELSPCGDRQFSKHDLLNGEFLALDGGF